MAKFVGDPSEIKTFELKCEKIQFDNSDGTSYSFDVDYHDVEHAFEIFSLASCENENINGSNKLIFDKWDEIRCLFQFAWTRTTNEADRDAGVLSPYWIEDSKQKDVKDVALSIGLSMTGIAFWDNKRDAPVGIVTTGDIPAEILVLTKTSEFDQILRNHDAIRLPDVKGTIEEINSWAEAWRLKD